jgi:hypothetical protein
MFLATPAQFVVVGFRVKPCSAGRIQVPIARRSAGAGRGGLRGDARLHRNGPEAVGAPAGPAAALAWVGDRGCVRPAVFVRLGDPGPVAWAGPGFDFRDAARRRRVAVGIGPAGASAVPAAPPVFADRINLARGREIAAGSFSCRGIPPCCARWLHGHLRAGIVFSLDSCKQVFSRRTIGVARRCGPHRLRGREGVCQHGCIHTRFA